MYIKWRQPLNDKRRMRKINFRALTARAKNVFYFMYAT